MHEKLVPNQCQHKLAQLFLWKAVVAIVRTRRDTPDIVWRDRFTCTPSSGITRGSVPVWVAEVWRRALLGWTPSGVRRTTGADLWPQTLCPPPCFTELQKRHSQSPHGEFKKRERRNQTSGCNWTTAGLLFLSELLEPSWHSPTQLLQL